MLGPNSWSAHTWNMRFATLIMQRNAVCLLQEHIVGAVTVWRVAADKDIKADLPGRSTLQI